MLIHDIDAVIFDLDGTLVDSMWMWKSIDIEYLNRFGIKLPSNLQTEIEGMSFTETAHYFKKRFNINDSIETIKNDWNAMSMDMYMHRVHTKPGVVEFLKFLKTNNIKTGIATSNSKELTNICLEAVGIAKYFDSVVTGCDVSAGKPNPEIYLKNADKLNVSCNKCLVFEDIPVGIMAGKNAEMITCAIYDDYSQIYDEDKRKLSDYYINDYFEFMDKYCNIN